MEVKSFLKIFYVYLLCLKEYSICSGNLFQFLIGINLYIFQIFGDLECKNISSIQLIQ